jgi:hypothetical protein
MDEVRKPFNSMCCIASSEPYRIYSESSSVFQAFISVCLSELADKNKVKVNILGVVLAINALG